MHRLAIENVEYQLVFNLSVSDRIINWLLQYTYLIKYIYQKEITHWEFFKVAEDGKKQQVVKLVNEPSLNQATSAQAEDMWPLSEGNSANMIVC